MLESVKKTKDNNQLLRDVLGESLYLKYQRQAARCLRVDQIMDRLDREVAKIVG